MTRTTPLAVLAALLGCSAAELQDTPNQVTGIEVRCLYVPEGDSFQGEPLLLGGITCLLSRVDDGVLYEQLTQPRQPLRFEPIEPGEYALTLKGRDAQGVEREYAAPDVLVRPGHRVTVVIDVRIAADVASAEGGLEWLGERAVNVLTAPFRFTARVLQGSDVEQGAFPLQESPSARSPAAQPGGNR